MHTMSSAPRYELLYFPMRGRAEQIRLLLAYTGTPFTDTYVTDWAAYKAKTPLGQLPLLIDRSNGEDWVIPQSAAIMRHLARTLGAYGESEREHVLADVVAETVLDVHDRVIPVAYAAQYHTPAQTVARYWSEEMPRSMGQLCGLLARSAAPAAGFFAAARPTYADLMVFDLLDAHLHMKPGCLDVTPGLKEFHGRISRLPALAAYLACRRPSELAAK